MSAHILRPGGKELHFDVVVSEVPEFKTTVTDYPVEKGANVADHMRNEAHALTLEVYVSDTPLKETDLEGNNTRGGGVRSHGLDVQTYEPPLAPTPGAVLGAIGNAVSNLLAGPAAPTKAQVLSFDKEFNAAQECLTILEQIRGKSELLEVVTAARFYSDMALTRIGGPKVDKDTGGGASFTLEFKNLRLVSVAFVAAPKPSIVQGHKMADKGKQDPKTPEPKKRSLLQSARKGAL